MNLPVIFYTIIVIILGVYVSLVLLISNRVQLPFKYLSIYVIMLVMSGLFLFLYETKLLYNYPHFLKVIAPILLTGIPSVFLSVKNMFEKPDGAHSFHVFDALLFTPALIQIVLLMPFYLKSGDEKLILIEQMYQSPRMIHDVIFNGSLFEKVFFYLALVYNFILLVLSFRKLKVYLRECDKECRRIYKENIVFVKNLLIVVSLAFISYMLSCVFSSAFPKITYYMLMLIVIIPITYLLVFLIISPKLLFGLSVNDDYKEDEEFLSSEGNQGVLNRLFNYNYELDQLEIERMKLIEAFVQNGKQYLTPNFKIEKISSGLGLNAILIRKAINHVTGKTYNDYINGLRISHFVYKIKNDSKWRGYSIEAISVMLGFQSTTTFYSSFKKIKNQTPKSYLDQVNLESHNLTKL